MSILGIILGLAFFIVFAYKGYNTMFAAILGGMIVALFGGLNPFTALTDAFMPKFAGFAKGYFLIFLFSALFAKIMGDSGAAASIALKVARATGKVKNEKLGDFLTVMTIPIIQVILTYGGVNVFVAVFIIVALARALFKARNIPWWLYSCSSLGSSTVTIGMLPGSPQFQNLIPCEYFGTDATAAPVTGIIFALLTFALGSCYIYWQLMRTRKRGEGFFPTGNLIDQEKMVEPTVENEVPLWKCILPMLVIIVCLSFIKLSAVISLFCGCVVGWLLFDPRKLSLKSCMAGAVPMAVIPLITVCCASGFGGIVAAVPGFNAIVAGLDKLGNSPLTIVLIVNVCAGICGSSSSGQNIALQTFSDRFIATGLSPEQLHRLVAMSSIGLDTLPHSAGIITMLSTTKLTHKQAYINSFVLSLCLTILMAVLAALAMMAGLDC